MGYGLHIPRRTRNPRMFSFVHFQQTRQGRAGSGRFRLMAEHAAPGRATTNSSTCLPEEVRLSSRTQSRATLLLPASGDRGLPNSLLLILVAHRLQCRTASISSSLWSRRQQIRRRRLTSTFCSTSPTNYAGAYPWASKPTTNVLSVSLTSFGMRIGDVTKLFVTHL